MDRAVLASIFLFGCSFTAGIPQSSDQPDASVQRPAPDATQLETPCHSQLPGLRLCLDFEDSLLTTDSSGHSYSIAAQNVRPMPRGTQRAAQLDAASSLSIQDSPDLDIAGPLSIEMWTMPSGYLQNDAYLLSKGSQYGFFVEGGQLMCGITAAGGESQLVYAQSSLPMNTWTHVACVFDGTNLKLYTGGNAVGCVQQTMPIATSPPQHLDLGLAMTGGLDDVHVYNAVLGDTDVCRLATGGTACTPSACN